MRDGGGKPEKGGDHGGGRDGNHGGDHGHGGGGGEGRRDQGLKTVAYFVNWAIYARNHNPQDLPADYLTHILYAFGNVRPESGEVYLSDPWSDTDKHYDGDSWNDVGTNLYGCMKQLFLVKKKHRNLKVLLSIGGWTYSSNFAQPASTEAGRKLFASSAVKILEDLGIDGIDIDWEYPQNEEQAGHYVELLREVRCALDAAEQKRANCQQKARFLLTVACPAGPENFQRLKIPEMDRYLDFWNLMAYDYAGSWSQAAGHQANLYPSKEKPAATAVSTTAAVEYYTGPHGCVHPSKIILGMPLYGRAFANTAGPGEPFQGVGGEGSWETGIWDFKVLPKPCAQEAHDPKAGASWSYDASSRTMVSYDTAAVVAQKAEYVRERGLGGGMWWESSADRPVGAGSLIETFVNASGGVCRLDQSPNCLEYPETKYENLRKQIP
ncbi:hypothetical protein DV738_g496, partial [Chaetothyriales sp. CBS 135597]